MESRLLDTITSTPLEALFLLLALNALRILGLSYAFVPFSWAVGSSSLLKMGIALPLSAPIIVANLDATLILSREANQLPLILMLPKEFAIGFGIGVIASGPFRIMQYAGALTDTFRGENDSGIQAPDQSQLHTFGLAYLVVGLFLFAQTGGWALMTGLMYDSYLIWPVDEFLPPLSNFSYIIVGQMFDATFRLVFQVAGPLLVMLFIIEMACYGGAKIGRRMGFYEMAFPIKNLMTLLTLPLIMFLFQSNAEGYLEAAYESFDVMRMLFE
ncbi:MAG: flagellar biosynthetic protein FliR [Sulfitobacter sp.]